MKDDPLALMRDALAGARTFVWEWDIDSDHLLDMDGGLSLLGYPAGALPHTQQAWNQLIHPDDLLLYQFEMSPDLSSRFNYVSERVQEIFGLTADEAVRDAQAVFAVIAPQDRDRVVQSVIDSARQLSEWRCEFRLPRPGGLPRWIAGSASPERLPDGRTVWHGYMQDVTAGHELEQARRDAAVAAAANHAKTNFLSRMSHELRTPLNAVLGFAQLMEIDRSEPPTPKQMRRLEMIRESGQHLLHMIGDLLDLTRIEAGSLTLMLEAVSLDELAKQALEMMATAASRVQVQLHLQPAGQALVVRADRTRLRQVLLNLLSNAIKYNRPGGQVNLRLGLLGTDEVLFEVQDNGLGIDAADLSRVFEPFHRGSQAAGTVEGAGIGLSVTQALVQMMAGRITVASTPGEGSTFSVVLPAYLST